MKLAGGCLVLKAIVAKRDTPQRITVCSGATISDFISPLPLPIPFKLSKIRWIADKTSPMCDVGEMMTPTGARYRTTIRGSSRQAFVEIKINDAVYLRVPLCEIHYGTLDLVSGPADVKFPLTLKKGERLFCSLSFTHHPVLSKDLEFTLMLAHDAK